MTSLVVVLVLVFVFETPGPYVENENESRFAENPSTGLRAGENESRDRKREQDSRFRAHNRLTSVEDKPQMLPSPCPEDGESPADLTMRRIGTIEISDKRAGVDKPADHEHQFRSRICRRKPLAGLRARRRSPLRCPVFASSGRWARASARISRTTSEIDLPSSLARRASDLRRFTSARIVNVVRMYDSVAQQAPDGKGTGRPGGPGLRLAQRNSNYGVIALSIAECRSPRSWLSSVMRICGAMQGMP